MDEKKIEAPDITNVHSLIFGDNNEHITDAVRSEARSIVSGVISEAIHDRERKDQSQIGRASCRERVYAPV